MQVFPSIEALPPSEKSYVFTLGNFDGLHRGHHYLIEKAQLKANALNASLLVLTFKNHPSWVLSPEKKTALLLTPEHKLQKLKANHVDELILTEFSSKFSELTPQEFLSKLFSKRKIKACVFGSDTLFGFNRAGSPEQVSKLLKDLGSEVTYLDKLEGISSSKIRKAIEMGDLQACEEMLGRPYSIYGKVIPGKGEGKHLGFPTLNLSVDDLCLPPEGVYITLCKCGGKNYQAVSNLGKAPTLGALNSPVLETHILTPPASFPEKIEVIFLKKLRSELCFKNSEQLKAQVEKDILAAKAYFKEPSSLI